MHKFVVYYSKNSDCQSSSRFQLKQENKTRFEPRQILNVIWRIQTLAGKNLLFLIGSINNNNNNNNNNARLKNASN